MVCSGSGSRTAWSDPVFLESLVCPGFRGVGFGIRRRPEGAGTVGADPFHTGQVGDARARSVDDADLPVENPDQDTENVEPDIEATLRAPADRRFRLEA